MLYHETRTEKKNYVYVYKTKVFCFVETRAYAQQELNIIFRNYLALSYSLCLYRDCCGKISRKKKYIRLKHNNK